MKIAAHPLVVAAAFGLLGPVALEEREDDCEAPKATVCEDCDCERSVESSPLALAPTIDSDELARAEAAWLEARSSV